MSKFLRELLDAKEPLFTHSLEQLEKATGRTGADARLIGEINERAHLVMRRLELDPADTTGYEFHRALLNRVKDDNRRVAGILGAESTDDVVELVPLIIKAANSVEFNRTVFVLKREVAKEFLRKSPPKRLMKELGYESIDKLFENEDFDEVYAAIRFSEGEDWLDEFDVNLASMTPDDFEERDMRIVQMDRSKYANLAEHFTEKKLHNVTHVKELGVIVVVPLKADKSKGLVLKTLPLLLHYMNEVKLYSTFFKLKAKGDDFGKHVSETLLADPGNASVMAGTHIHWRVIQRYFGKLKAVKHPEIFEPHVHPEDLHWRSAEELLCQIDPTMKFWRGTDYVGLMYDGQPLSLNFVDVALTYANNMSYDDRYFYHFRESLWNEIFARYMGFDILRDQILKKLDNDMIAPEQVRERGNK